MIKLTEQLVPVKVNTDNEPSIAKKYKVQGLPAIVFLDGKGKQVGRFVGYRPPEIFAQKIEEVLRVHKELPKLEATFAEQPDDLKLAAMLASAYAARGNARKAAKTLKIAEKTDPDNKEGFLTEAYMTVAETFEGDKDFRNAGKWYSRSAKSASEVTLVVDSRMGLARSCFFQRTKLKPGSKGVEKKLKKCIEELEGVLAMEDLAEDQKTGAEEMLKGVQEELDEHLKMAKEKKNRR